MDRQYPTRRHDLFYCFQNLLGIEWLHKELRWFSLVEVYLPSVQRRILSTRSNVFLVECQEKNGNWIIGDTPHLSDQFYSWAWVQIGVFLISKGYTRVLLGFQGAVFTFFARLVGLFNEEATLKRVIIKRTVYGNQLLDNKIKAEKIIHRWYRNQGDQWGFLRLQTRWADTKKIIMSHPDRRAYCWQQAPSSG